MQRASGWSRALKIGVAVLLACASQAASAHAQEPGFNSPSLDQYIESVPTGGVPAASHRNHRDKQRAELPASVRHDIAAKGGADARALSAVATSPTLGAPASAPSDTSRVTSTKKPPQTATKRGVTTQATMPETPGTLAATSSAVGGAGTSPLLLLLGMFLLTAAIVGVRVRGSRYR